MSDILIRGMEMPTNEPLLVKINPDGSVSKLWRDVFLEYANCKAIPIPPHGRCIDAGSKTFPTPHRNPSNDYMKGWNACLRSVQQQPTIIPTEKEWPTWRSQVLGQPYRKEGEA